MPETAAAFDRFIERAEQSMDRRHDGDDVFLWLAEDRTRLEPPRLEIWLSGGSTAMPAWTMP